jgi:hypothetical protein
VEVFRLVSAIEGRRPRYSGPVIDFITKNY